MPVVRDIELLSISFTAGVVISAIFHLKHPELLLLACAALMVACAASSGSCKAGISLLFLLAGSFCYASNTLGMRANAIGNPLSIDWLSRLIDGAGFAGNDTAGLLKAVLTGDRSGLSAGVKEAFRASGASHILALSGLHLGTIYLIVRRTFAFVGNSPPARVGRSLACIILCGCYAAMTGAGPSISRAFLFILSGEIASMHPDRERKPLAALCLALIIQLAISPGVISSLGFQLSYLAMLGIFILFPVLEGFYPQSGNKTLKKLDLMRKIWTSIALSLACQAFTGPLVWYRFHTFPEFFMLTNLIALPLTEMLILLAIPTIGLSGLGLCPDFMIVMIDRMVGTLTGCLFLLASD